VVPFSSARALKDPPELTKSRKCTACTVGHPGLMLLLLSWRVGAGTLGSASMYIGLTLRLAQDRFRQKLRYCCLANSCGGAGGYKRGKSDSRLRQVCSSFTRPRICPSLGSQPSLAGKTVSRCCFTFELHRHRHIWPAAVTDCLEWFASFLPIKRLGDCPSKLLLQMLGLQNHPKPSAHGCRASSSRRAIL